MNKKKDKYLLGKLKEYEDVLNHHTKWSFRKIKKYREKWKLLSRKYNQINIYGIEFVSIGETIPRLFMYLNDRNKQDSHTYNVILPTFFPGYYIGRVVNQKIFEVFGEKIHFVTEKNIDFWKYILTFHADIVNNSNFDNYKYRDISVTFNIPVGKPLLALSSEVNAYAKGKMLQMGVTGDYVCIHAREVATKTRNFVSSYDDTSVIDANINTYGLACNYMKEQGCQAIRIGKDESRKCEIDGVIDYANDFYDELMDFYLVENCKFIIGGMAGIVAVAPFWGRPALITNALSFCYGKESLPRTEYDLYIPKKFYSKRHNRYLNLYESWDMSFKCDRYSERFAIEEIEIINNTDEEILNATVEMNQKLNHTWIESEEEKRCMEKYWEIINLWKNKHELSYLSKKEGGRGRDMFPYPICYSYLRENMYLLDVGECYEKL